MTVVSVPRTSGQGVWTGTTRLRVGRLFTRGLRTRNHAAVRRQPRPLDAARLPEVSAQRAAGEAGVGAGTAASPPPAVGAAP